MVNPYFGWGLRDKLSNAINKPFRSVRRSKEHVAFLELAQSVYDQIRSFGLDEERKVEQLAEVVTLQVFAQFDVSEEKAVKLAIFSHLNDCVLELFKCERMFDLPPMVRSLLLNEHIAKISTAELWEAEEKLKRISSLLVDIDTCMDDLVQFLCQFMDHCLKSYPDLLNERSVSVENDLGFFSQARRQSFDIPLSMTINELPALLDKLIAVPFSINARCYQMFSNLCARLEHNIKLASGHIAVDPRSDGKNMRLPSQVTLSSQETLIRSFLKDTVLESLFDYKVQIVIPDETRFQHHHIIAGTGHGKTQTLQHLILNDLGRVSRGKASVVVLDSQGDLISNISHLAAFAPGGPLADRLVVIDPTDIEYPVALNLFDVSIDRINQYSMLDQERMINGILELYDFVLGSLLDAQMTQKQSVIFRYITRLMMRIPNATIHTLRELLEEGGAAKYQVYIDQLEGSAKAFFRTEFDSREFTQTKKQVLRRLWGILENRTFERMFSHPRNRLKLFEELNSGKVILINTAKELLKESGTEIFGRFFIALISQAAQERAVIDPDDRMPTFVYIDEASEYFDHNVDIILSQARKFKVGMILAHQYLGQLSGKLQESVFTNTKIKFAGGVSSRDANTLASELRTKSDFIENMDALNFAAYVHGTTRKGVQLTIKPGQMEALARMSEAELRQQRETMRQRFAVHYLAAEEVDGDSLSQTANSNNGEEDQKVDDLDRSVSSGNTLPSNEPSRWRDSDS